MYLGVGGQRGDYAVFVLGSRATSTGEGSCEDTECRVFGLKEGESQLIDVLDENGNTKQFYLDVDTVEKVDADSATAARRARLRVHPDGRDVLRNLILDPKTAQALGPIRYNWQLGLVVTTESTTEKDTTTAP